MAQHSFTLNNGVQMPSVGFGVFQTPPDITKDAVATALKTGYRHIDTAAAYANERGVGEAIKESNISRKDIFVETKIWINDYGYEPTLKGFEKSARKLSLPVIDLVILHQALPSHFDRTIESYRALEKLQKDGKVRAIGVSNFMPDHLTRLLTETTIVPAVNQIELHPYFQQKQVQKINAQHGILTQAWSPIGGITSYRENGKKVLEDTVIIKISQKHNKTPAQILLRWHIQAGRSVIPKSVQPNRIAENFDIFDFTLSDQDIQEIDDLDTDVRRGPDPNDITLETFSRVIPDE